MSNAELSVTRCVLARRASRAQRGCVRLDKSHARPCAASRVAVRLPSSILYAFFFLAEPLPLSFDGFSCAALPSVNLIEGATHTISVVNPFDKPVTLYQGMAIAAVPPIQLSYTPPPPSQIAALQQRRSEARYNERHVEHLYTPGALVRVLQHGRHFGAHFKLVAPFSGLCEVLEVKGPVLTLRELDC